MKSAAAATLALALACSGAGAARASPVGKVVQLLSGLQSKLAADGKEAKKVYQEFAEFCDDRSQQLGFEIKTGKAETAKLEAVIERETSLAVSLGTKTEELIAGIARDEADLKQATEMRAREAANFAKEEVELMETISVLQRAVATLEREMQKGGAALVQVQGASSVAEVLRTLVEASAIGTADGTRLSMLLQRSSAGVQDEDAEPGAPSAAVYESHSGGIVETLQGLLEKAESQLAATRKAEAEARHTSELLKQSLEDGLGFATKELAEAKRELADSSGRKAEATGAVDVASKDLKADETSLADLKRDCMTKAEDYEAAVKSRDQELSAVSEAKKVIEEATGGAEKLAYGAASLLQLKRTGPSPGVKAARLVRDLARRQRSTALAQLASRLFAAAGAGASDSENPFAKVKGLITDMLARLEEEADADATHKAFCDKQLAEGEAKKADKTAEIEKLSVKFDQMSAQAAQLNEEVAALQKGLAELAASQAEMDKLRKAEHEDWVNNKADMEQGLEGVKTALKILREYYAQSDKSHAAAEGAGSSVIGLLEVIESDFSKGLVEMTAAEEAAQKAYDAETKENEIERAAKGKDVEYQTRTGTKLGETASDVASDRAGVQTELDAVLEFLEGLKKQCVAKAETYAERKARREAELAGLKEALSVLEGEAMLLQRRAQRTLRSPVRRHQGAA